MNEQRKIGTVLTALDESLQINKDIQAKSYENMCASSSRVFYTGRTKMEPAFGARHFPDSGKLNIRVLLYGYLGATLGRDTVAMMNPDVKLDLSSTDIQKELEDKRLQMTWGFSANLDDGSPGAFIFSSSVVPSILNFIPNNASFGWDWHTWLDAYLKKYMGRRYFTIDNKLLVSKIQSQPPKQEQQQSMASKVIGALAFSKNKK